MLKHPSIHWLEVGSDDPGKLLTLAKDQFSQYYDYFLWLEPEWGFIAHGLLGKGGLEADGYRIRCSTLDGIESWKTILLSTQVTWRYDYVTQQAVCDSATVKIEFLERFLVVSTRTAQEEEKAYAVSIQYAIELQSKEPESSTLSFYLGHYYARLGDHETAKNWYERCLYLNPRDPVERALSTYYSAELKRQDSTVELSKYYEAFELAPGRAEALAPLIEHFESEEDWEKAYQLSKIAFEIPRPQDAYPIEYHIYNYKVPWAAAHLAKRKGDFRTCIEATSWVLEKNLLPEETELKLRTLRQHCLNRFYPVYPVNSDKQNRIAVITCFRNAGIYLQRCIESIKQQNYDNYHVYLVDDASDDACTERVILDSHFTLIQRTECMEALQNQHDILLNYCDEDDIALFLDGDDWLLGNDVFMYINRLFNQSGCWVSYGQCSKDTSNYKLCVPPKFRDEKDLCHLGEELKYPIHPRCHRAGLYHRIADQDPEYRCLKDEDGAFYTLSSDYAHMRAMFQLAGPERVRFVDKLLYAYNTSNPLATHIEHHQGMLEACANISEGPFLAPIANYRSNAQDVKKSDVKTELLIISLEGFDSMLAQKWIDAGYLPALHKLLNEGDSAEIAIESGFFSTDAFLTSCVTGARPHVHQNLWAEVLQSGSYDLISSEEINFEVVQPYWDVLSDAGKRVCVLNYYAVPLSQADNVTQVQNWGVHVSWGKLRSHPIELAEDLVERFGDKHLNVGTERAHKVSLQEHLELKQRLLDRVDSKLDAYLHYLQGGGWNAYHVCFDEAHDMGHQLWHVHDPDTLGHPDDWLKNHGDPLLAVYQSLDEAVARLRNAAGNADVLVIAGSGIQAASSCSSQLEEMLRRIQCAGTGETLEKLESDWLNQAAFTLQSNHQLGAVRIHVAGREPCGWIQPGEEFEHWFDTIEEGLMSFIDPQSGKAVVEQVVRTRAHVQSAKLTAMGDSLPDMVVVWRRIPQPSRVVSAKYGEIKIEKPTDHPLSYRTGDHNENAKLFTNRSFHPDKGFVIPAESIAPTICRYFGVDMLSTEFQAIEFEQKQT